MLRTTRMAASSHCICSGGFERQRQLWAETVGRLGARIDDLLSRRMAKASPSANHERRKLERQGGEVGQHEQELTGIIILDARRPSCRIVGVMAFWRKEFDANVQQNACARSLLNAIG